MWTGTSVLYLLGWLLCVIFPPSGAQVVVDTVAVTTAESQQVGAAATTTTTTYTAGLDFSDEMFGYEYRDGVLVHTCNGKGAAYCGNAHLEDECPRTCALSKCLGREPNDSFLKLIIMEGRYDFVYLFDNKMCMTTCRDAPRMGVCSDGAGLWIDSFFYCTLLDCSYAGEGSISGCHNVEDFFPPDCEVCQRVFPNACTYSIPSPPSPPSPPSTPPVESSYSESPVVPVASSPDAPQEESAAAEEVAFGSVAAADPQPAEQSEQTGAPVDSAETIDASSEAIVLPPANVPPSSNVVDDSSEAPLAQPDTSEEESSDTGQQQKNEDEVKEEKPESETSQQQEKEQEQTSETTQQQEQEEEDDEKSETSQQQDQPQQQQQQEGDEEEEETSETSQQKKQEEEDDETSETSQQQEQPNQQQQQEEEEEEEEEEDTSETSQQQQVNSAGSSSSPASGIGVQEKELAPELPPINVGPLVPKPGSEVPYSSVPGLAPGAGAPAAPSPGSLKDLAFSGPVVPGAAPYGDTGGLNSTVALGGPKVVAKFVLELQPKAARSYFGADTTLKSLLAEIAGVAHWQVASLKFEALGGSSEDATPNRQLVTATISSNSLLETAAKLQTAGATGLLGKMLEMAGFFYSPGSLSVKVDLGEAQQPTSSRDNGTMEAIELETKDPSVSVMSEQPGSASSSASSPGYIALIVVATLAGIALLASLLGLAVWYGYGLYYHHRGAVSNPAPAAPPWESAAGAVALTSAGAGAAKPVAPGSAEPTSTWMGVANPLWDTS